MHVAIWGRVHPAISMEIMMTHASPAALEISAVVEASENFYATTKELWHVSGRGKYEMIFPGEIPSNKTDFGGEIPDRKTSSNQKRIQLS